MTVIELATAAFRSPSSTINSPSIAPLIALVSERQSAWSGFPIRFYQNKSNPSEIFLVSGWTDVPAHHAWMGSEGNKELLGLLEPYLEVVDLIHIDAPFESLPDAHGLVFWWDEEKGTAGEGEVVGKDADGRRADYCHIATTLGDVVDGRAAATFIVKPDDVPTI